MKKVPMRMCVACREMKLKEGYTREYGAREMDRVITGRLKPLLMREILFGSLKKGGSIKVEKKDDGLSVRQ